MILTLKTGVIFWSPICQVFVNMSKVQQFVLLSLTALLLSGCSHIKTRDRSAFVPSQKSPTKAGAAQIDTPLLEEPYVPRNLTHSINGESEVGNLYADAIRSLVGADLALVNPGMIRGDLKQGVLTEDDLDDYFPFDQEIMVFEAKGSEVIQLLTIAENGARGVFPVSGARLWLVKPGQPTESTDLDADRRIAHWEVDRVREIRTLDGERIQKNKTYKIATIEYLCDGGDDLKWIMSRLCGLKERQEIKVTVREAVAAYLRAGQVADLNGRIRFEKPPKIQRRVANRKSRKHQ